MSKEEEKPKRIRMRNFLLTQWVNALERGGGKKTKKEHLIPKSRKWFEEQLEGFANSQDCRYLVYQIEKTDAESSHYQIYIETVKPIDKLVLKKYFHRTTSIEKKWGSRESARHYSMKGSCGVEKCQYTWKAHPGKRCYEFAEEVEEAHVEYGVWVENGQRTDLKKLVNRLREHERWVDVLLDEEITIEVARYGTFARQYFEAIPPKEMILELNPWQRALLKEVTSEADDRKIIWFYDPIGGMGKTTIAKYLARNHGALVVSGKKADILHAYDKQKIVIFDYTRSMEGFISYSAMEEIKNGCYFSSKYHSQMVIREGNCHVVVFANWVPEFDKLSADRWDFRPVSTLQSKEEK